jgi:glycerol uptake facilitator-like aquaporin
MPSLAQRVFCEWLGTAFLLAAVVGSGIMAQRLAGGNVALALLCNTLATGAVLPVLILIFGPLSGAHFNPACHGRRHRLTCWHRCSAGSPAFGPRI